MATKVELKGRATLDTAQFEAASRRMEKIGRATGLAIGAALGTVGVSFAAVANEFDRIAKLAKRTGETTDAIQRIGFAASQAGADVELVVRAMSKMTVDANKAATEGGTLARAFDAVGISAKEFVGLSVEEKLVALANAYELAQGNASQMASLMELLGNRAQDLIPLLAEGADGIAGLMKEAPVLADQAIEAIERANDSLDKFITRMKAGAGAIIGLVALAAESAMGGDEETRKTREQAVKQLTEEGKLATDKSGTMSGQYADPAADKANNERLIDQRMTELRLEATNKAAREKKARLAALEANQRIVADAAPGSGGGAGKSGDADVYSGIDGGAGAFAPGYLSLDTTAAPEGFSLGIGVTPPTALESIEGANARSIEYAEKQADKNPDPYAAFANFATRGMGAQGGLSSAPSGMEVRGGLDGGAYGLVRRGDAASRKAAKEEGNGSDIGTKLDTLITAVNTPTWVEAK